MKQPEALRLAHVIAEFCDADESLPLEMLAPIHDELKRLHEVNQKLLGTMQQVIIRLEKDGDELGCAAELRICITKATGGQS